MYFKPDQLNSIANQIKNNNVGILPFDTVPGLTGRCCDEVANRIFDIKGRDNKNPLLIVIPSLAHLSELVVNISSEHKRLIDKYWPGPLTLIFEKSDRVPDSVTGGLPTVAIRFPEYVPLNILLQKVDQPIISTSANRSGQPSPKTILQVNDHVKKSCDFYLDGYECLYQDESTIVDAMGESALVLRQGILSI